MSDFGSALCLAVFCFLIAGTIFINLAPICKEYNSVAAWCLGLHTISKAAFSNNTWRSVVRFVSIRYIIGYLAVIGVVSLYSYEHKTLMWLGFGLLGFSIIIRKQAASYLRQLKLQNG